MRHWRGFLIRRRLNQEMEGMDPYSAQERTREGVARRGDVGHSLPRASPEDRTAIQGPRLEPASLGKKGSVSTNQ
jgi:hypothetical protein